jgi:molybdopterin/thiamine biosynthesis adenylyltransferase
MDSNLSVRFSGANWFPQENEEVVIGGAGGIGSWLALLLARIGFKIYLVDFDRVEMHNIGGQFFKVDDVSMYKTQSVNDSIQELCGTSINTINERVEENFQYGTSFMFSAFDNMKARKNLFKSWKYRVNKPYAKTPIFIDGRLTMEQLQIFCVTEENMDVYERDYLFNDSEVEDTACTTKQTSHSAAMIASHMVGFFTNHIANIHEGAKHRAVPFKYEYFIPCDLTISDYHESV